MRRVILLSEFFPPHHGGIEDTLGRIAASLGPQTTVVTPPQPQQQAWDAAAGYTIIRRSLFGGQTKPSWLWLLPWLWTRRGDTDLVVFGHYSAAVTAGWLLSFFGRPYAIIVHGHDLLSEMTKPGRSWLGRSILRRAQWIGANSQYMTDRVHQAGVPLVNIVVLHPMINDQALNRTPALANESTDLITVCRLVQRKNVAAVIMAVATLKKDFPQLRYHLVGDGPEGEHLKKLSTDLGLADRIIFHGPVSDAAKWDLLRRSGIGVMTPRSSGSDIEGFGLFFLEASAAGLPVVASRSGGVPDAVQDGKTGLIVEAGDEPALTKALRDLLADAGLRRRMGQAGRQYVEQEFSSSIRQARLQDVIQRQDQSHPPLVSVVIPAYQSASTIPATVKSLFAQTWPHLEIIVVDDGSTDHLPAVLKPYGEKIQSIRQANQGAAAARNTGAAKAQGEFLLFVDADTVLDPDLITTMVVAVQTHPSVSFAYSNFRFGPKGFHLFEFSENQLRRRNYIHTTSLLRRSAFPGFDPSLKKFQDWDLWLTMIEHGHGGLWIPRELFWVSQRTGGMSTWLPSFVYDLPFIGQGRGSQTITAYRQAEAIIQRKHRLPGVAK